MPRPASAERVHGCLMRCGPFGTPKEVLMKRWMVVALVGVVAAVLVPAALAGGDYPGVEDGLGGERQEFLAEGYLQAVVGPEDGGPAVTVTVTKGTREVKSFIGGALTVALASNCAVIECVDGGELRSFEGLQLLWERVQLDDPTRLIRVRIRGTVDSSDVEAIYVITRLQVHAYIPVVE